MPCGTRGGKGTTFSPLPPLAEPLTPSLRDSPVFRLIRSALAGMVPLCALVLMSGCFPFVPGTDTDEDTPPVFLEQVLSSTAPRPPVVPAFTEVEPNDDFETANLLMVEEAVELTGTIAPGSAEPFDRDLFDIGPAQPGDRVRAELVIDAGSDVVLALLDDRGRELGYVDLKSASSGPRELDVIVRSATKQLYLVLATRSAAATPRPYTVRLHVQRGLGVPDHRPQVVVLNFLGASQVRIGNRAPVDIPPFDAARIDPSYAGQTTTIIQNILNFTRHDFDGLGMAIYLAGDPEIPEGPVSTVYFGTSDARLLGLADNIDPYNENLSQSAILYTDTFSVFSILSPSVGAISQALANTASHEIGHLVGLRHTENDSDIMDITATARRMLSDQWFRNAPLHPAVLSIGWQDGPVRLSWTLGGRITTAPNPKALAASQRAIDIASGGIDFYIPRSLLSGCGCGDQLSVPDADGP
jgi:hypothetical protein